MLLASLLANLLALAMPIFVIQVLNRYVTHGVDSTLLTLSAGAVIAVLLELAFRQIRIKFGTALNAPHDASLARASMAVLTGAKAQALESVAPGVRRQLINGPDTVQNAYTPNNMASLMDVPFALLFILVLYLLSPVLALVCLLFTGAAFAIALLTTVSLRGPSRTLMAGLGRRNALASSGIAASDTIRAFNAAAHVTKVWDGEAVEGRRLARLISTRQAWVQSLTSAAQGFMGIAIIGVGAAQVVAGNLDVGALIGANILAARALGPMIKLA